MMGTVLASRARMVRNPFAASLMTLSLALVVGCSSTDTERAKARKSPAPATFECSDQCSAFDACEIMDTSSCVDACRHDTFTQSEISCLAAVPCTSEAFEACFELEDPDALPHRP